VADYKQLAIDHRNSYVKGISFPREICILVELSDSQFAALPVVRSMGVTLFDWQWAERAHISTSCELLYVVSGEVELHLHGRRHHAGPGDLLLVPSGTEHRDDFDLDAGLQVFMVSFHWDAEEEFFRQVSNEILRGLPAYRKAEIAAQVERLHRDTHGDAPADLLVARARLFTILMLILREAAGTPAEEKPDAGGRRRRALTLAARRYLDRNYAQPLSLEDVARALDVSPFYLSHVFSEENDFSLIAYLTTVRMEKARELLQAGAKNVSEVARGVGYENSNYFSKVFRRHFGFPPSELRAE